MKKIDYKVTTVEQKEEYIITLYCDICKKLIFKYYGEHFEKLYKQAKREETEWYEITTGHHDWGNDSWESIIHKEICPECLEKEFKKYFERANGSCNSEYLEIEHHDSLSLILEEVSE